MTATSEQRIETRVWLRAGELLLAAALYFLLARGSLTFASLNLSVSPVWPPTGLAIALLLMRGNTLLPAVLAGAFAANYFSTPSILTAGMIATGNTLEAYVATNLIRRWADGERVFHTPVSVVRFALIVSIIAAPLSATIGAMTLAATGYEEWGNFAPVWITWWLGNIGGAILMTPALVLWMRTLAGQENKDFSRQTLLTLVAAAATGTLAFTPLSPVSDAARNALAFLVIMPLLWAALRLGLRDAATTALLISSLAVWGVIAGVGPFVHSTLNDALLLLVTFILAATLPSLALAAERHEAQLALDRTREELVRAQKLEALGQLTGGVAHDFNNLLMAIGGALRTLERQDEERAKTLGALGQALDRGTSLTKQLLAFAGREPVQMERLDTAATLAKALVLVEQTIGETVRVESRIAPGLWPIKADRAQLELAILNLAVNARDAMPNGGAIRIEAENIIGELGKSVSIAVSDEGAGMSEEVMSRAFEPFFSTKGRERGTGLGLAQVYTFAKRCGGSASIQSEPGRGATVTITLPRA